MDKFEYILSVWNIELKYAFKKNKTESKKFKSAGFDVFQDAVVPSVPCMHIEEEYWYLKVIEPFTCTIAL